MADQLTEAQILEFKQGFSLYAKTDKGIPLKEVGAAMRALGVTITDKEAWDLVTERENVGETVEFPEFLSLMARKVRVVLDPKQELLEAFKVFDRDGNGKITVEELRHVASCFGEQERLTEEEIKEMIGKADVDGDGLANYEEFVKTVSCLKISDIDVLTEAQIFEFKQGFSLFAKDDPPVVLIEDLGAAMRALGVNITDSQAWDLMKECGNESESVDFPEFLRMMARKNRFYGPKEELLEAFRVFDREGNGKIAFEEFKHVVRNVGEEKLVTEKEAEEFMRETVTDGDSLVDYEEFIMTLKDR